MINRGILRLEERVPRALTIAGSDSGGGAGVQADLKTFASLGVYGMSAITSITAQNTVEVRAVFDLPPEMIREQIRAVVEDIGVDAAKTGMLHTEPIIFTVAEELGKHRFPVVVDPVMIAKSGARLLVEDAVEALKRKIVPLATVLTPNRYEAEALSGLRIGNLDDAKRAAEKIAELGAEAVLVKGGHISGQTEAVDVLFTDGAFKTYSAEFIKTDTDHGTGCTFSSAIAAELAKGKPIDQAVETAKQFITKAIKFGIRLGKGHGPTDPMAWLQNRAEKYVVVENLRRAGELLESSTQAFRLVPEVQMNLVMALPHASDPSEVAGIPGRIVKVGEGVKASSCPRFGASRHLASAILTAMEVDPRFKAAMNIRYSPLAIEVCRGLGLKISSYDRGEEPESVKKIEGGTIPWGTRTAIEKIGCVPDVVYHLGDWGKEPMISVLGRSAVDVVEKALKIAERLG